MHFVPRGLIKDANRSNMLSCKMSTENDRKMFFFAEQYKNKDYRELSFDKSKQNIYNRSKILSSYENRLLNEFDHIFVISFNN